MPLGGAMQSAARIALTMCVLISAVSSGSSSSTKLRRNGVLNLYPFPRVGRAHHTWQVPINDEYLEMDMPSKRQLYAFPRVGRSDFARQADEYQPNMNRLNIRFEEMLFGQPRNHDYMKRASESSNGGMWFGPRVGRAYNNNDGNDDINNQNDSTDQSDPEQGEAENNDRKKRHTKQV